VNAWIQDITVTIGFVVAMVIVAGIAHVYIGDAADSLNRFRDRLGRCYNRFEQPVAFQHLNSTVSAAETRRYGSSS
jgi:hypothetical protein